MKPDRSEGGAQAKPKDGSESGHFDGGAMNSLCGFCGQFSIGGKNEIRK